MNSTNFYLPLKNRFSNIFDLLFFKKSYMEPFQQQRKHAIISHEVKLSKCRKD